MSEQAMSAERHICKRDDPWTPQKSKRAVHPDASRIGGYDGFSADHDDYDTYQCPHCGKIFDVAVGA